jgi:septal ring factor EnvC (AmiA/AmiB activator)
MEQKLKIILIALIAILALSFFLNFQTYISKQAITRERDSLKSDNESLVKKANDALQQSRDLQSRINALTANLDKLTKEKTEIQSSLDLVNKERADLIEQVNFLKRRRIETAQALAAPVPPPSAPLPPSAQDTYWAGILKEKTDLELQLKNINQELATIKIDNEQLQKDKNSLLLEVNNLEREKADLARQIEYNRKLMDSMAQELAAEKVDKFQIQGSTKSIKQENAFLRKQLKALNKHKIELERKLSEIQEKNDSLDSQLSEMESMLMERITKTDVLKQDILQARRMQTGVVLGAKKEFVELPPIVVRPQKSPASGQEISGPTGKVLAVNRENNFIIIDLGEDNGVTIGNIFKVYRGDRPIAEVSVMQTRRDISACDIKKQESEIKLGDTVK